jgi:hypothetical protein
VNTDSKQPHKEITTGDAKVGVSTSTAGSFEMTVSSRTPDGTVSGDVKRTYSVPTS